MKLNNEITPQAEQRQLIRDIHQNLGDGLIHFSDVAQLINLLCFEGDENLSVDEVRTQMDFYIQVNKSCNNIFKAE